jgi:hypothetical protein
MVMGEGAGVGGGGTGYGGRVRVGAREREMGGFILQHLHSGSYIKLTLTEYTIEGNKKTYSSSLLSESIGMIFGTMRCFSIVGLPL